VGRLEVWIEAALQAPSEYRAVGCRLRELWDRPMIVTPRLSVDIVRYLSRRTQSRPLRWVALSEIADHVYGPEDVAFSQAVDLARCRGWIIVEGKAPSKRACLTKAGCLLVPPAVMGRDGSPMITFALAK
jgi:hypothetical protein